MDVLGNRHAGYVDAAMAGTQRVVVERFAAMEKGCPGHGCVVPLAGAEIRPFLLVDGKYAIGGGAECSVDVAAVAGSYGACDLDTVRCTRVALEDIHATRVLAGIDGPSLLPGGLNRTRVDAGRQAVRAGLPTEFAPLGAMDMDLAGRLVAVSLLPRLQRGFGVRAKGAVVAAGNVVGLLRGLVQVGLQCFDRYTMRTILQQFAEGLWSRLDRRWTS